MSSARSGKRFTGTAEVVSVTAAGVSIIIDGRERFMPFAGFPWFKDATIAQILNVEHDFEDDLRWPDLDVDLHVESIDHPERFPLIWRPERVTMKLPITPRRKAAKKRARKSSAPRAQATRSRAAASSATARAR